MILWISPFPLLMSEPSCVWPCRITEEPPFWGRLLLATLAYYFLLLGSANLPALAPAGKQEPKNHENDNNKQSKNNLADLYDVLHGCCCAGLAGADVHNLPFDIR
jgi:hypothetical protein